MKKFLSMMFVIASTVCLYSCSEYNDPTTKSPIAGTKWCKAEYFLGELKSTMDVIEFTETDFYKYTALHSGEYCSGLVRGQYTYDFINQIIRFNSDNIGYTRGVLDGNFLNLYGNGSNGKESCIIMRIMD